MVTRRGPGWQSRLLCVDLVAREVDGEEPEEELFRLYLMRRHTLREGLTAVDDRLPDRFFGLPGDSRRFPGVALDRQGLRASAAWYYAARGWDEDAVPTPATLHGHHLEWTPADSGGTG